MQRSFLDLSFRGYPLYQWLGLAIIIGLVAFFVYDHIAYEPKARTIQGELQEELKLIKPPQYAQISSYHVSHKTHQALVDAEYTTNLSYPELRRYYDAELPKHGWRFYREDPVKEWFIDYGGKSVSYCKGEYAAALFYRGEEARNYSFSVSWGLHNMDKKWCRSTGN